MPGRMMLRKEPYFTTETIDEVSGRMIREMPPCSGRRIQDFVPQDAALLIIDMQEYFLSTGSHAYIPAATPVVPKIRGLAGAFLAKGLPVIATRHANTESDAGNMAVWWGDFIREDDEESLIIPELRDLPDTTVIKTQYDAFFRTGLEAVLRKRGVRQVVVTGVMTHLCCETTARSAFMRGFPVFIPVDGTATCNERFHTAALLNLSHGFAVSVLVSDLISRVEGSDAGG